MFAVDRTFPGRNSMSVNGIRLTKTRNPLMSSSADLPPMPDPSE